MEEIEVKHNDDSSIRINEESLQSQRLGLKIKDKKVNILPVSTDKSEKSIKVPFKKIS